MGKPKTRTEPVQIRLTPAERERWGAAAAAQGMALAVWVRWCCQKNSAEVVPAGGLEGALGRVEETQE